MSALDDSLAPDLRQRRNSDLYRYMHQLESPQGSKVVLEGREVLAFSSNDYLGLANHPSVIEAFMQAAETYGVGAGASHLICGHSREHHQLEEELAEFTGRARALVYSTGYMANLGIISALVGKGDLVLQDKLNHASLLDGGFLSGARFQRYLHADTDSLDQRLTMEGKRKLVVTDGVFSMDGDIAPLPAIASICARQGAWLMVDDAHGFGVLGEMGGGVAELYNLDEQKLPVLMGTLGKAFGTAGAFVAGSETLIEYLIQFSRPYIYTTAMPPAIAAASRISLKLAREESWRRQHLQTLIRLFRAGAEQLGLRLMPSDTPIQAVLIGSDADCLAVGAKLWSRNIHVGTIRPPTVPRNTARLRITFSANHSEQDVEYLLAALNAAVPRQTA